jgi:hypothetical protein
VYQDYRTGFITDIEALYQTRNEIIHNAEIDLLHIDDQVDEARKYASQMFLTIASDYIDEYNYTENMLSDLSKRDPPVAPEDHNPFYVG